jgi:hypothetical protein
MSACLTPRGRRSRRRHTRARFGAIALGCLVAAISTEAADAEIAAAWNFNGIKPFDAIQANEGDGWIDLAGVGGDVELFDGTLDNAMEGWRAGDALGLRGTAEGGTMTIFVPIEPSIGKGAMDYSVSFATRRSANGFTDLRLDVWQGGVWTAVETFAVGTTWSVSEATFSVSTWTNAVDLRLVPIGAAAGSGTFRLDNLVIDVSTVPAPGVLALLGVAGGCVLGRRRDRLVGVARR